MADDISYRCKMAIARSALPADLITMRIRGIYLGQLGFRDENIVTIEEMEYLVKTGEVEKHTVSLEINGRETPVIKYGLTPKGKDSLA